MFENTFQTVLHQSDFVRLRNAWVTVSAFAKAQFAATVPVIQQFQRSGVTYSLLKGAAAGYRLYDEPHMRTSWDFDIGVSRRDLKNAESIVLEAGFRPVQKDSQTKRFVPANRKLRAAVEAQHYELGFLARRVKVTNLSLHTLEAIRAVAAEPWTHQFWEDVDGSAPWCYSLVDVHHALSLDIDIEDLLSTSRIVSSGENSARIPNDSWLAAHLIFKVYWEGVHSYNKGLYQLADLTRLIPRMNISDFASLVSTLEHYGMIAAGHYVLRRIPECGAILPDHVAVFIHDTFTPPAGADPIRINDLGDMWAKLWGHR